MKMALALGAKQLFLERRADRTFNLTSRYTVKHLFNRNQETRA